ncbi:hypothetical protein C882_1790 [Caenispirillum salinarum AK4]|uniref:Membrane protein with DUF350 domain protein n=1 Tax=Caenispirillum salinarum AK4 TaxID=1238182 RepID=K9H9J5_9PROT|nr:DUF350 domain-containing protein [Caenispirillum salinarum]EKV27288.1 hypothetical protein C882_1790 [Caenispirillum salinarum AK4]
MLEALASFALYFATAIVLLFVFQAVYMAVTPHRETELIKGGNVAAATAYIGALIGFVLPLASALANSVSLVDFAIWGVIAGVVQVLTWVVVRTFFYKNISESIVAGTLAPALKLAGVSVSVGILNAASMTY